MLPLMATDLEILRECVVDAATGLEQSSFFSLICLEKNCHFSVKTFGRHAACEKCVQRLLRSRWGIIITFTSPIRMNALMTCRRSRGGAVTKAHATQILEITCQRTVSVSELSLEISSDRARALVRACFYCMNFSVSLSFNDNYLN